MVQILYLFTNGARIATETERLLDSMHFTTPEGATFEFMLQDILPSGKAVYVEVDRDWEKARETI